MNIYGINIFINPGVNTFIFIAIKENSLVTLVIDHKLKNFYKNNDTPKKNKQKYSFQKGYLSSICVALYSSIL